MELAYSFFQSTSARSIMNMSGQAAFTPRRRCSRWLVSGVLVVSVAGTARGAAVAVQPPPLLPHQDRVPAMTRSSKSYRKGRLPSSEERSPSASETLSTGTPSDSGLVPRSTSGSSSEVETSSPGSSPGFEEGAAEEPPPPVPPIAVGPVRRGRREDQGAGAGLRRTVVVTDLALAADGDGLAEPVVPKEVPVLPPPPQLHAGAAQPPQESPASQEDEAGAAPRALRPVPGAPQPPAAVVGGSGGAAPSHAEMAGATPHDAPTQEHGASSSMSKSKAYDSSTRMKLREAAKREAALKEELAREGLQYAGGGAPGVGMVPRRGGCASSGCQSEDCKNDHGKVGDSVGAQGGAGPGKGSGGTSAAEAGQQRKVEGGERVEQKAAAPASEVCREEDARQSPAPVVRRGAPAERPEELEQPVVPDAVPGAAQDEEAAAAVPPPPPAPARPALARRPLVTQSPQGQDVPQLSAEKGTQQQQQQQQRENPLGNPAAAGREHGLQRETSVPAPAQQRPELAQPPLSLPEGVPTPVDGINWRPRARAASGDYRVLPQKPKTRLCLFGPKPDADQQAQGGCGDRGCTDKRCQKTPAAPKEQPLVPAGEVHAGPPLLQRKLDAAVGPKSPAPGELDAATGTPRDASAKDAAKLQGQQQPPEVKAVGDAKSQLICRDWKPKPSRLGAAACGLLNGTCEHGCQHGTGQQGPQAPGAEEAAPVPLPAPQVQKAERQLASPCTGGCCHRGGHLLPPPQEDTENTEKPRGAGTRRGRGSGSRGEAANANGGAAAAHKESSCMDACCQQDDRSPLPHRQDEARRAPPRRSKQTRAANRNAAPANAGTRRGRRPTGNRVPSSRGAGAPGAKRPKSRIEPQESDYEDGIDGEDSVEDGEADDGFDEVKTPRKKGGCDHGCCHGDHGRGIHSGDNDEDEEDLHVGGCNHIGCNHDHDHGGCGAGCGHDHGGCGAGCGHDHRGCGAGCGHNHARQDDEQSDDESDHDVDEDEDDFLFEGDVLQPTGGGNNNKRNNGNGKAGNPRKRLVPGRAAGAAAAAGKPIAGLRRGGRGSRNDNGGRDFIRGRNNGKKKNAWRDAQGQGGRNGTRGSRPRPGSVVAAPPPSRKINFLENPSRTPQPPAVVQNKNEKKQKEVNALGLGGIAAISVAGTSIVATIVCAIVAFAL